jgi:hypothetical protein
MPFNPVLQVPDSAFKTVGPGFGLNLGTLSSLATKAPIVGGIVSNLGSVAKLVGIHVDMQSPASHIAERIAVMEPLKQAAMAGNDLAWEKLWTISSRKLPVRHVDTYPQNEQHPFFGFARVDKQAVAMLREVEAARGGLPKPSGYGTTDIVGITPAQILQLTTTSLGGAAAFTGIGDSPASHDGAQSNPGGVPSSTNKTIISAALLVTAVWYFLLRRK